MSRTLFLRIAGDVANHDPYFQQRPDATGRPGLSTIQKCTAALRLLAYGASADSLDENLRMAESTALETLKRFCLAVNDVYAAEALTPPNVERTHWCRMPRTSGPYRSLRCSTPGGMTA